MRQRDPSQSLDANPLKGAFFGPKLPIPEPVRKFKDELRQLCVDTGANGMRFVYRDRLIGSVGCEAKSAITPTASCTKSLAAVTIFKLKEMGWVDIDQPLSEILKDQKIFTLEYYSQITPRHLLTHMSGLPGNDYFMPKDRSRRIPGGLQFLNHLAPLYDRNTRAAMHPLAYKVESTFDYSNPGSQILEAVASRVLARNGDRRSVSEFIHAEILEPLGMKDTSLSVEDGVTMFNSGMLSTADDLVQLGKLINNMGLVNGHQVLSPDSIREMVSTTSKFPKARRDYGHLWWKTNPVKGVMAQGDLANLLLVLPEHNVIVTRTHSPALPKEFSEPLKGTSLPKLLPFSLRVALSQQSLVWKGLMKSVNTFVAAKPPTERHFLSDVL